MKKLQQKTYKVMIDNNLITVEVTKKKMKSISIIIKGSHNIALNIPNQVPYEEALKMMQKKKDWISEKLKKHQSREKVEGYYFLGRLCSLEEIITLAKADGFLKNQKEFSVEEWYLYKLEKYVRKYVEKHALKMGGYPKKINIKFLKSAWGICYSSGTITFNLDLIKTPTNIIEYVVVHELGHMKHPNHSKEYWDYIARFINSPKHSRKWLKENGYKFITKK